MSDYINSLNQPDNFNSEEARLELLRVQNEFFAGICVGTILSAVFFMKVFKKKIYLLIVFFNSVQIIFEVVRIVLVFID